MTRGCFNLRETMSNAHIKSGLPAANLCDRRRFLLHALTAMGGTTLGACGGNNTLTPQFLTNAVQSAALPEAVPAPPVVQPSASAAAVPPPSPAVAAPGVPAWVPPPGYFADIPMRNTPFDVTPSFYTNSDMAYAYDDWGGSAILKDFSPLGAQVLHSAGHEAAPGLPNIQFALICDFTTLLFSVANLPAAPNRGNTAVVPSGSFPDGTPYSGHSYLGLQEFPAAWGGGPKGSLMSFAIAGSPFQDRARSLDVSKVTGGYGFIDKTDIGGISNKVGATAPDGGTYPTTAIDYKREGWWLDDFSQQRQSTIFLSKTGGVTLVPALHGNMSDGCIVLCHSLDLLVAASGGYMAGPYNNSSARLLRIRDLATGTMYAVDTIGLYPSLTTGYDSSSHAASVYLAVNKLGMQWVDNLRMIVGFDQGATPPRVVTLTPGPDPKVDPWTWGFVSLSHWDNGDSGGQANLIAPERNNVWSRFRYVDALDAFVLASDSHHKPQVIRLVKTP